jgi:hypothetical protein
MSTAGQKHRPADTGQSIPVSVRDIVLADRGE